MPKKSTLPEPGFYYVAVNISHAFVQQRLKTVTKISARQHIVKSNSLLVTKSSKTQVDLAVRHVNMAVKTYCLSIDCKKEIEETGYFGLEY